METKIIYTEIRSLNHDFVRLKLKSKQFYVWQGTLFIDVVSLHQRYTILRKTLYPLENYRRRKSGMK